MPRLLKLPTRKQPEAAHNMRENDDDKWDERLVDKFNPVQMARRKQRTLKVPRAKFKTNKLTLIQKELSTSWIELLELYQLILGRPIKAHEMFVSQKHKDMRSKSILDVTLDYSRVTIFL